MTRTLESQAHPPALDASAHVSACCAAEGDMARPETPTSRRHCQGRTREASRAASARKPASGPWRQGGHGAEQAAGQAAE